MPFTFDARNNGAEPALPAIPLSPNFRMLVVDDDPQLQRNILNGLLWDGFRIFQTAGKGLTALYDQGVTVYLAGSFLAADALINGPHTPRLDHLFLDDDLGAPQGLFRRTGTSLFYGMLRSRTGARQPSSVFTIAESDRFQRQLVRLRDKAGGVLPISHLGKDASAIVRVIQLTALQYKLGLELRHPECPQPYQPRPSSITGAKP